MAAPGNDSGWLYGQGAEPPSDQQAEERKEGWGGHWELLGSKLLIGELHEEHPLSDLSTILMSVLFEIMTHIWTRSQSPENTPTNCVLSQVLQCAASNITIDIIFWELFPRFFIKV